MPTEIQISATYPGATAEVLADTVAAPIEQEINGVKNMIYMYSNATSSGYLTIGVVFDIGTDPDQATIDVNNKVQAATPKLPSEVTKQGVTVEQKSNSNFADCYHAFDIRSLRYGLCFQLRIVECS